MILDHRLRELAMIEIPTAREISGARQKAVLLILAAFDGEPLTAEFLAAKGGMSHESARLAVERLIRSGLVERIGVRAPGRPGVYRVVWGRVGTLAQRDAGATAMHQSRAVVRPRDETRAIAQRCGALRMADECDPGSRVPAGAVKRREVVRMLRAQGLRRIEIAQALGWNRKVVGRMCASLGDTVLRGAKVLPGEAA